MSRSPLEQSTLQRPRIAPSQEEVPSVRLEVVAGPDAGAEHTLDPAAPGRVYVGKSEACQLRLADPLVSRRHFALEIDGARVRITDLDSTNGTLVNAVPIAEAFLHGGELVRVGDTTIAVRFGPVVSARLQAGTRFGRVIGASPEMLRLYPICERLALSDVPVILEGETGTGKELLAEAIHEASPRASGPFVVFDCTTSPPSLMEAKLFGHEKGAFTGATTSRPGVFEEADGGTLLIDEIGDLDVALQAKLLRAVQSGQVQRLGGTQWLKTNVRILAATRRDLEREIQEGRFRDDLYYRLAVARVELPPLRRRRGDVALLAEHFWTALTAGAPRSSPMPPDFLARLLGYAWPGNVRELSNVVANKVALGELADAGALRPSTAPPAAPAATNDVIGDVVARGLPFPQARQLVLGAFEERYVDAMLAKFGNNISKAAAASGVARRYFYTVRARHGR
jgi:two-component system, NtrC family, response regulator HydG